MTMSVAGEDELFDEIDEDEEEEDLYGAPQPSGPRDPAAAEHAVGGVPVSELDDVDDEL
jgi:hypothetical protein